MTEKKVYHEKQVKQLCALHSLNNLLQASVFTQKELDSICKKYVCVSLPNVLLTVVYPKSLSPNSSLLNPHKSFFGLGNYDVNVIMFALQTKQLEAVWFDRRKDPECLELSNIYGFILNLPNPSLNNSDNSNRKLTSVLLTSNLNPINFLMSRKHWIAIKKIEDFYYNLDSKLAFPEIIGKEKELLDFLRCKKSSTACEILVIVDKCFAANQNWMKAS